MTEISPPVYATTRAWRRVMEIGDRGDVYPQHASPDGLSLGAKFELRIAAPDQPFRDKEIAVLVRGQ